MATFTRVALYLVDLARDELHHASRWWMRAARALPGTPVSAKARLKALEALPQIARFSLYTEQRAREIKLDRAHPLRYLQRYLSDQLHFKIPAPPG